MLRKMLVSAIIATAVFAAGSAVYAQAETGYSGYRKDTVPVFGLQSDKSESKTFDREYIISGNAKEGTEIIIDLYWFSTEDEKSIIAKKKSDEGSENKGSWILQQTEKLIVGASGLFAEPVALNLGKNRIVLLVTDIKGNEAEKTLEVERFLEKQASKEVNGEALNKLVEEITIEANENK